jgi:hypothetical protein
MLLIWRNSLLILYNSYDLVIWLQSIFGNTLFLICFIWFLNVFGIFYKFELILSCTLCFSWDMLHLLTWFPFSALCRTYTANPCAAWICPTWIQLTCIMWEILLYTYGQTQRSSLWKILPMFKNLKAVQFLCVEHILFYSEYQCKHSAHMPSPLNFFQCGLPKCAASDGCTLLLWYHIFYNEHKMMSCLIWKRVTFLFLITSEPSALFSKQFWE